MTGLNDTYLKDWQQERKRILVAGAGKTGLSVCRFLHRRGMEFSVADDRADPPGYDELAALGLGERLYRGFDETLFASHQIVILSPGIALSTPAVAAAARQGNQIIGDIELFATSVQEPVLAVTGSNGKSTVASWLASALRATGARVSLCGNIGLPALDALDDPGEVDIYVLELSSFQLETTRSLKPLAASVLNVSEDHMDRYASLADYARVKRSIFRQAEHCIVNADDPLARVQASEAGGRIQYFTRQQPGNDTWGIASREDEAAGAATWLASPAPTQNLVDIASLPLPGDHNALNALVVLAMGNCFTDDTEALVSGLLGFTGLPHRIELVRDVGGIRWYNDSKGTNVDAACRAIEAMQRPVVLIAGGIGKDADFKPLIDVVQTHVRAVILIGRDAPRLHQVLQASVRCHFAESMAQAVSMAVELARDGDAVLLSPACSSFDMFDNFEHRGDEFSRHVQELAA